MLGAEPLMLAARWYGRRELRVERLPLPELRPGDALVRIERVGLCGSDVEQYLSGRTIDPNAADATGVTGVAGAAGAAAVAEVQPIVLGHELVGVVERCPSRPELVGRRVIPDVVQGCGSCWWCLRHEEGLCPQLIVRGQNADGGLAEYFAGAADRLVVVPPQLGPEQAVFAEPLAVAVRAVEKCGELRGAVVAVIGLGIVGNLIAQLCERRGVRVVGVDPSASSRLLAARTGIVAVGPDEAAAAVFEASDGRGADAVFECAGVVPAFAQSPILCRSGGTVLLVGISEQQPPFSWRDAVLREIRYLGTAAHMWDTDVRSAVQLLGTRSITVDHLVSRVIGLHEVGATLEALAAPNALAKVLVDPARKRGTP